MEPSLTFRAFETTFGTAAVLLQSDRLLRVFLPENDPDVLRAKIRERTPEAVEDARAGETLVTQLQAYFRGEADGVDPFAAVPVWEDDDSFNTRVWRACREIPFGETSTYGELAERVGSPRAARAVGAAMANNPTPIVVPCHRVLRRGGALGGFSATAGVSLKQQLLDLEQGALVQSRA